MKEVAELLARVADLERRVSSMALHGTVEQVDAAKGLIRVKVGEQDGEPLLSPWVPYAQIAGGLKVHAPPTVGQQMTMISPGGDFRQGVAVPMTWSDANASPSSAGDANALTFGDVRIDLTNGGLKVTVGGSIIEITGGAITMKAATATTEAGQIDLKGPTAVTGASLTHNGKNVGDDHKHKDVLPGPSLTGPPA